MKRVRVEMGRAKWIDAEGYHILLKVVPRKFGRPQVDDSRGIAVKIKANEKTGEIKLFRKEL